MTLRLTLIATLAAAQLIPASPVAAQKPTTTETFAGCPAAFGMVTLPDPRSGLLPGRPLLRRGEARLIAQCVGWEITAPPICPSGMIKVFATGRDTCIPAQSSQIQASPADPALVVDGSSNTVMFGETPASAPASASAQTSVQTPGQTSGQTLVQTSAKTSTTRFSSVPQTVFASCAAPAEAVPDAQSRTADVCVLRVVAVPGEQIPIIR